MISTGNYHQLFYHVTWATRERLPMIDSQLRQPLYDYLKGKTIDMGGIAYVVGGVTDHIHLCLTIPPNISISKFIGQLKGASAHWINHFIRPGGIFGWQDSYGVFTISKDLVNRVITYIENQEKHHQDKMVISEWEIGQ